MNVPSSTFSVNLPRALCRAFSPTGDEIDRGKINRTIT